MPLWNHYVVVFDCNVCDTKKCFANVQYNVQPSFDNVRHNVQTDLTMCKSAHCGFCTLRTVQKCKRYLIRCDIVARMWLHIANQTRCSQIVEKLRLETPMCQFAHCRFHNVQKPKNGVLAMCKLHIVKMHLAHCQNVMLFFVSQRLCDFICDCVWLYVCRPVSHVLIMCAPCRGCTKDVAIVTEESVVIHEEDLYETVSSHTQRTHKLSRRDSKLLLSPHTKDA